MTRLQQNRFSIPVLLEYIAKTFVVRFLIMLIGISVIMQTLDVLSQSGEILSADGATTASLWRFTMIRYPQMVSNVVAFSALLAALVTYANLAQHSEIVVMQSSGLSAFRIVLPVMGVCALIALAHFVMNETIVMDSNEEYERWKSADFAVGDAKLPPPPSDAWALDGETRVRVQAVSREGTILDKVTLYALGENQKISKLTAANFAAFANGKWTLFDVTHFDVGSNIVSAEPRMAWDTDIPPERFRALSVDPNTVSFGELQETVRQLAGEGLAATRLTASLNHKVSGPLGTILMPLLAGLAAFGVIRSGALFLRVIAGMAFGFSFFIVDNLLLAIGQFGTVPPALAAWSPLFLFFFLGSSLLFYTEE